MSSACFTFLYARFHSSCRHELKNRHQEANYFVHNYVKVGNEVTMTPQTAVSQCRQKIPRLFRGKHNLVVITEVHNPENKLPSETPCPTGDPLFQDSLTQQIKALEAKHRHNIALITYKPIKQRDYRVVCRNRDTEILE
jgi:hypothetical protein